VDQYISIYLSPDHFIWRTFDNFSAFIATFPLPFKLHKLKLRIENMPNGNMSILQELLNHKKFLGLHEVAFLWQT